MKALKIFLIAFFPMVAFSQSSVSTLTTQNNATIYGNKMTPVPYGNMYQGIINSYANLLGSYANPGWITSLGWSKITSTPSTLNGYGITIPPGNIFVGNVSSVPTGVALSGDGTLSSAGSLSVTKLLGNTIPSNASGALTNDGSGALSWTSYQPTISLTTTGTSGASTLIGQTLNIPIISGFIPGMMQYWPTITAPSGWLLCDGSAVSRTTYANLFSVIGTTFGVGNGSTTFNLPTTGGKFIAGYTSGDSDYNAINKVGGEKTHVLTIAEMPSHHHTLTGTLIAADPGGGFLPNGGASSTDTGNTGGDGAHENRPPFITLSMIIKY